MSESQPEASGRPVIVPTADRPTGHRSVPLLGEHQLDHYPEFRDFLATTFSLSADPFGPPGLIRIGARFYELVFIGYSGRFFPAGLRISALAPGLEPLAEEQIDRDLWALLGWLVDEVGGDWSRDALETTGRIYRVPLQTAQE